MARLTLFALAALATIANPVTAHGDHDDDLEAHRIAARALPVPHPRCRRQVACVLAPEATEGPYYYSYEAVPYRQNIVEDRAGVSLTLKIAVVDVNTCAPVTNAAVDVWHADASGIYSHYVALSQSQNGGSSSSGGPGSSSGNTDNSTFLRGITLTDSNGVATVQTIFPGWYTGRTTHIHVKVHLNGTISADGSHFTGGSVPHTGQFFFSESDTASVYSSFSAYSKNSSATRLTNAQDNIYQSSSGDKSLMTLSGTAGQDTFSALITVGIDAGGATSGSTTVATSAAVVTKTTSVAAAAATSSAAAGVVASTTSVKPSGADRLVGRALAIMAVPGLLAVLF